MVRRAVVPPKLRKQASGEGRPGDSMLQSLFGRRWLLAVLLAFAAESIAFFVLSAVPVPQSYSASLLSYYHSAESSIQNASPAGAVLIIFTHNLLIATLEMIPGLGLLVFSASTAATGLAVGVLGSSYGAYGPALAASLYLAPHTWFELPAYAIGLVAGLSMAYAIVRRKALAELKRFAASWVLMALLLLFAAILESGEIKIGLINPLYLYLLWIPAFLAIIAFYMIMCRRRGAGLTQWTTR